MSEHDLVTIDSYVFLGEAELARATLEAAGIAAVLADDNVARLGSGGAHAHGGVRLRVQRRDLDEARAILDAAMEEDASDVPRELTPSEERCRRCFSEEVYPVSNRLRIYAAWLLGWMLLSAVVAATRRFFATQALVTVVLLAPIAILVAALIPSKKKCRSCGMEWR
ncbi:MAG TPA: DUF2007 domain-containing protein [Thermoanaerobaculia bacterium]|nr:DUF2007 domain-containing protein [Thermoanaerobaculia bacterium]